MRSSPPAALNNNVCFWKENRRAADPSHELRGFSSSSPLVLIGVGVSFFLFSNEPDEFSLINTPRLTR
jgi:hypothetical protein